MKICDLQYRVMVNPPLVTDLKISNTILTDLMIYPHVLSLDFADETRTKIADINLKITGSPRPEMIKCCLSQWTADTADTAESTLCSTAPLKTEMRHNHTTPHHTTSPCNYMSRI